MKRAVRIALALILLSSTCPCPPATAVVVFDPTNFAQNILQVMHEVQSNINEVLMIKNQLKQLTNELRNLESLKFDIIDEYSTQFQDLFRTVGEIDGLIQNLDDLESKFEELYPNYSSDVFPISGEELRQKTKEWHDTTRDMIEGASKTGAQVMQNLPQTQSQLEHLMEDSQGAVGILQATQAGNQIAANIAGGLTTMNSQMATYQQATSAFLMEINSVDAAAKNRMETVLGNWGEAYSGTPIKENPFK